MQKTTDAAEVRQRRERMAKTARVLCILFDIILVLFAILDIAALTVTLVQNAGFFESQSELVVVSLSFIVVFSIGCLLLFVLSRIFKDISKGNTPFSNIQARRIWALGALMLVYCVAEIIISANPLQADVAGMSVLVHASPGLYIDIKLFAAAVICFCLSYVFRYGALLQWLQDETL